MTALRKTRTTVQHRASAEQTNKNARRGANLNPNGTPHHTSSSSYHTPSAPPSAPYL